MTQRDAVDDVFDRFGNQLEDAERRAERRSRPSRTRRLVLAGAGLALAGSAAVLMIGTIGGGSRLDVVSQAEAALAPDGTILHMKIAYGRFGQPDDPATKEIQESWSATDPNRWKFVQITPYVRWSHGKAHETGQYQSEEFAFAGGTLSDYNVRTKTMTTVSGYPESGPKSAPFSFPGMPSGQSPTSTLRTMLASGRLTSAGRAVLSGKSVLKIRGRSEPHMERGIPAMKVEYDVDETTFAPVRMVVRFAGSSEEGTDEGPPTVIWFRAFERLPITAANETLLTVVPAEGTKIKHYQQTRSGQPCQKLSAKNDCLD